MTTEVEVIAERLKDVAHDMSLLALTATLWTGPYTWTTIQVREARAFDEAPDGWVVTAEDGGL